MDQKTATRVRIGDEDERQAFGARWRLYRLSPPATEADHVLVAKTADGDRSIYPASSGGDMSGAVVLVVSAAADDAEALERLGYATVDAIG